MPEGPVFVEGMDNTEATDVSLKNESETDSSEDTTKEGSEEAEVEETETEAKEETEDNGADEEKVELTEKGTKLDKDPLSAAHQQLANAKRTLSEYEAVLRNPEALKTYAKEMGISLTEAKTEIKEDKAELKEEIDDITPEKIKTVEQLASVLNSLNTKVSQYNKRLDDVDGSFKGITENIEVSSRAARINNDIQVSLEKYPEIDPKNAKNGTFNAKLSDRIGELYHKLDYDPATKQYRGNISFSMIADSIMETISDAEKTGTKKAQTIVKEKVVGKSVTGSKGMEDEEPDQDLTSEQIIAKQMAKANKKR